MESSFANDQVSREHHFVPKFLLKPWLISDLRSQSVLMGYWWDSRRKELAVKIRGLNSFCFQLDLLTLSKNMLGRDALERIFFGDIDTRGAKVRDSILDQGTDSLCLDERCDFGRLLLSLEARRPSVVRRLRTDGRAYLATELDADSEIRSAFQEHGIAMKPSEYVESNRGSSLEDRALSIIQKLVDNPIVGGELINALWGLKVVKPLEGTLVLSDRPLIRICGYNDENAVWVLPLSPTAAFVAANSSTVFRKVMGQTGQRFVKSSNISSAHQADRFVFSVDTSHEPWLKKHLRGS